MDHVLAEAQAEESPALVRVRDHLGTDPTTLPTLSEQLATWHHPNLQLAIDDWLAEGGRTSELLGISSERKRFEGLALSDLLVAPSRAGFPVAGLGPSSTTTCPSVPLGRCRASTTASMPSMTPRGRSSSSSGDRSSTAPPEISRWRCSRRRRSAAQPSSKSSVRVATSSTSTVDRSSPSRPLAGRCTTKRGGRSPSWNCRGSVMHLLGRACVVLTGGGLRLLRYAFELARSLQPATIVLEDIDLVAEDRELAFGGASPLLFELLNAMDGLDEDADLLVLLTTNRVQVLEPALAARPGRVDQAVELPLPDADGRRALLERYGRGLDMALNRTDEIVDRTAGVPHRSCGSSSARQSCTRPGRARRARPHRREPEQPSTSCWRPRTRSRTACWAAKLPWRNDDDMDVW